MSLLSFGLGGLTYLLLLQIPKFTFYQRLLFSFTLFLTNVTFGVLTSQFVTTCIFIYTRSRYLNLLLNQFLQNNTKLPKWYEMITNEQIDYNDFNYLSNENDKIDKKFKKNSSMQSIGLSDDKNNINKIDYRMNNWRTSMGQLNIINRDKNGGFLTPKVDSVLSTFTLFDIQMLQKM